MTFVVRGPADLEAAVSHHTLTSLSFVELGLEFESERTAGPKAVPLYMLAQLVGEDIRNNAQQIHGAVEGGRGLDAFFEGLDRLQEEFPWTLRMVCPMALASVEGASEENLKIERFPIAAEDVERVSRAYAEMAFDAADLEDELAEEAAAKAAKG